MGPQSCPLQGWRQSGLGLYDILKLRKLPKKLVKTRAHHELTCKLIRIQPAGISISKIPIQDCMDKLPWVTCLNRSGTCRTTDHPRITDMCRYPPQVFASTYYYYYIKCIPVSEIVQLAVQNASKNTLIGLVFIEIWLKL